MAYFDDFYTRENPRPAEDENADMSEIEKYKEDFDDFYFE